MIFAGTAVGPCGTPSPQAASDPRHASRNKKNLARRACGEHDTAGIWHRETICAFLPVSPARTFGSFARTAPAGSRTLLSITEYNDVEGGSEQARNRRAESVHFRLPTARFPQGGAARSSSHIQSISQTLNVLRCWFPCGVTHVDCLLSESHSCLFRRDDNGRARPATLRPGSPLPAESRNHAPSRSLVQRLARG